MNNETPIGYKLTTQDLTTHGNTQWEVGVSKTAEGEAGLCTSGCLHYYSHPVMAAIFNPIHADIKNPRLWKISVETPVEDDGIKYGCKTQTLLEEIPLPQISIEQLVEFGIHCAMRVYKDERFQRWAQAWLSGEDRSARSAYAANAPDASDAARAAARAADDAAARSPYAAARSPYAAAHAASRAADSARAAVYAASPAEFIHSVLDEMGLL